MPIIGKFIKKTTERTYKRLINKQKEFYLQVHTLMKLVDKAKRTKVGVEYDFYNILNGEDIIETFQKNVPLSDYNSFYTKWLIESMGGGKDVIWPGRVRHYALSSGTTGSPSKRIPITTQMIRSFQKTSLKQISTLHGANLNDAFFQSSILTIGGSTKLTKLENHIEGDLSGILKKYTTPLISPFTKPGEKITRLKDWNEKLDLIIDKAPEWNIGIVAGVPSWCILMMEKIVEKYQLKNIHDIWPNFQVYVHGGVFMKPYLKRLQKTVGHDIITLDTYLASEGYFAYQTATKNEGMDLLINNGVFFEFIPFNSDYFDDKGNLINQHNALTLNEVEKGLDYALVISTNAGLWRYMIGDLVRFVNTDSYEIIITGRITQYLSLTGEHLSLDNINNAIQKVTAKLGVEIAEFCLHAVVGKLQHKWYLGVDAPCDSNALISEIDKELNVLNDDYASVRKHTLLDPLIKIVPAKRFYGYMEEKGKLGAQNKFPRVLNDEQIKEWNKYLEKFE